MLTDLSKTTGFEDSNPIAISSLGAFVYAKCLGFTNSGNDSIKTFSIPISDISDITSSANSKGTSVGSMNDPEV